MKETKLFITGHPNKILVQYEASWDDWDNQYDFFIYSITDQTDQSAITRLNPEQTKEINDHIKAELDNLDDYD